MKIAASSYSFRQLMDDGTLNQLSLIKQAKDMGFDAVEFVEIMPHDGSSPQEYAKKLREEAERQEMPVANFTVGADLGNGGEQRDVGAEIERVKGLVDLAAILGAGSMRHDAAYALGSYRSFGQMLPDLAIRIREITEYAAEKGVKTMIENHGYLCQDSLRVEQLVDAVAHPNFGLLVDMGNFLCADDDPFTAYSRTAPYAFYAHAKDFIIKPADGPDPGRGFMRTRGGTYLRGTVIGQGNVPVVGCLTALKRAGYNGYIGIEFEGMEDPLEGIAIGLENLKNYIALVG